MTKIIEDKRIKCHIGYSPMINNLYKITPERATVNFSGVCLLKIKLVESIIS